jgi:hypothetical protein
MEIDSIYEKKTAKKKIYNKSKKNQKHTIILEEFYNQEYEIIDDIKIYNGIFTHKKNAIIENIKFYDECLDEHKRAFGDEIFTKLIASTLTAKGRIDGVSFKEEDFIRQIGSSMKVNSKNQPAYVVQNYKNTQNDKNTQNYKNTQNDKNIQNNITKIGCNFGEIYSYPNQYILYKIETLVNAINKYYSDYFLIIECGCTDTLKNIDLILDKI